MKVYPGKLKPFLLCCVFSISCCLSGQTDSVKSANRYITRATLYGVGYSNVYDTYLSPQEYKGIDFRVLRETIRMTKLLDGNVSVQNLLQADLGYTHNQANNNNMFSGMINWKIGRAHV